MKLPKGLRIKDIQIGTGEIAQAGKIAVLHYECYLPRGEKWDTSRNRQFPFQFRVGQRDVVVGIEYGVIGMAVGGIRSVRVSPQLTHLERKINPALPLNVALRYEIELIRISDEWDNSIQ